MKKRCGMLLLLTLLCCALSAGADAMENDMLRVGIKYGDSAMNEANLQNYSDFGGYALGYYDDWCDFTALAELPDAYEKITVTRDLTCHVQLSEAFDSYDDAARYASYYEDGFVAYEYGDFFVRVGSYESASAARSALSALREDGEVVGGSDTGVTVIVTGTDTVLFEFDCGSRASLGIEPIETTEKTVTWFRGYRYYGGFEYQRASGGAISVINVVSMEDYVKCVIPWEMNADWPIEALKAQAVCARTYAATQTKHSSGGFDVCATTHCQVYQGTAACSSHSDSAVEETAGEYLYYNGSLVREALYYASNGGASESSENVWGSKVAYLQGKEDPYEAYIASIAPKYSWSTTYTASELTSLLSSKGYNIGTVKNVYVSGRTDTDNVCSLTFVGTKGTKTVTGESCRTLLNLRSQRYTVNGGTEDSYSVNESGAQVNLSGASAISGDGTVSSLAGSAYVITADGISALEQKTTTNASTDSFVISGTGNGHQVGMSQWGAYAMANLGYDYEEILEFYYTGVTVK